MNEEGFQKLAEEISLKTFTNARKRIPWGKEEVTLYYGEVPMSRWNSVVVRRLT